MVGVGCVVYVLQEWNGIELSFLEFLSFVDDIFYVFVFHILKLTVRVTHDSY